MNKTKAVLLTTEIFANGNKLFIIGNGGSAAMASHMSGEFLCKMLRDRHPLPAITLTDPAVMTAISNDFGFQYIYSRQIRALGDPGDGVIIFTTSGKSKNIRSAISQAKSMGIAIIEAPRTGTSVADIQERQLHWLHYVCRKVEGNLR